MALRVARRARVSQRRVGGGAEAVPITHVGTSAWAQGQGGAASTTITHTAGIQAGDLIVILGYFRYGTNAVPVNPTGFTRRVVTPEGGTGGSGVDVGTSLAGIWTKVADGTETTTVLSTSAGNNFQAVSTVLRGAGSQWRYAPAYGLDTSLGTAFSATTAGGVPLGVYDQVLTIAGEASDTITFSGKSITASGVTFGTVVQDAADSAYTFGAQQRAGVARAEVTAATSKVAAVTYAMTLSAAQAGAVALLRVRSVNPGALQSGLTRQSLLAERHGFGRLAGGTANGAITDSLTWDEYVVSNTNDSGVGSLRDALSEGQRWITFTAGLTGTTRLTNDIEIPRYVVVDGRGADYRFDNYGLRAMNQVCGEFIICHITGDHSVISGGVASNLTVDEEGPNPITIGWNVTAPCENWWIHHVTVIGAGQDHLDGGIDIVDSVDQPGQTRRGTVSWTKFQDYHRTALCGSEVGTPVTNPITPDQNPTTDITFSHNYWLRCVERQPYCRGGDFHVLNNLYQDPTGPGENGGVCIHSTSYADVLAEGCMWRSTGSLTRPTAIVWGSDDGTAANGYLRSNGCFVERGGAMEAATPPSPYTPDYSYTVANLTTLTARNTFAAAISANAGSGGTTTAVS